MESDDEVLRFSSPEAASSPVRERQLKRLKKANRVSQDLQIGESDEGVLMVEANSSKFETLELGGSEEFDRGNDLDSGFGGLASEEDGLGVKRALDFGEGPGEEPSAEIREESGNVSMEELEKKRRSSDSFEEEKEEKKNKKRKKRVESGGGDETAKETSANKRRSEKVCRLVKF